MKVLELKQIHRTYAKGKEALRGVDLSMEKGEVVGLLGRNGAGKTTLLRVVLGMIHAQQGTVRIFDEDPWKEAVAVKQQIGYVAEEQILPAGLSVSQVLALHESLYPTYDENFGRDLVARFNLDPYAKIRSLSKGQARQAALICAVAHKPRLLLLDEPAGGLDPAARREFLETAVTLMNQTDTSILFSSHYMSDVERLANRVALLHDGKLLLDRELDDLHTGFSMAVMDPEKVDHSALDKVDGIMSRRRRKDGLHVVVARGAEEANAKVRLKLDDSAFFRALPLEELFIELVEGQA